MLRVPIAAALVAAAAAAGVALADDGGRGSGGEDLASAHEHAGQAASRGETLGRVSFPVSCTPAAQERFDRAVAILHSFWYEEAAGAFAAVAEADPGCAMAQWGAAMSLWYPLWYPPNEAALKAGADAVAKAQALGAGTDRERDYIAAIAAFYGDRDRLDHRTRSVAYERAMGRVHQRHPEDREAGVFYALALLATASPTDKTYANQLEAAALLEPVFAEQPDHPGVAHYLSTATTPRPSRSGAWPPRASTP